jgi:uncharacterized membrane-anchored protein
VRNLIWLLLTCPLLAWGQTETGPQAELRKLAWQVGPTEGRIAEKAVIKVPEGYVFLDSLNTRRFLELAGNPPRDGHFLFAPRSLSWFAVFSFDPTGYVKDDEKIDPDDLLRRLKESDEPSNEERKRLGMPALYTDGWQVPPHYDPDTKRLEWGMRLRTEGGQYTINYTSRLLGRSGVMSAVLVADLQALSKDTQQFKAALTGFSYMPGEKYSEFKAGDKVAEYGLAALVLGGAAAAAAKTGILKTLGKFIWIALLAVVGIISALWRRFTRRGKADTAQ